MNKLWILIRENAPAIMVVFTIGGAAIGAMAYGISEIKTIKNSLELVSKEDFKKFEEKNSKALGSLGVKIDKYHAEVREENKEMLADNRKLDSRISAIEGRLIPASGS